jgi:hypothetical protein
LEKHYTVNVFHREIVTVNVFYSEMVNWEKQDMVLKEPWAWIKLWKELECQRNLQGS